MACHRKWQRTKVREATRSHAFGSPSSSEGRKPERLDQTKNN
jgi:hypothetical protein